MREVKRNSRSLGTLEESEERRRKCIITWIVILTIMKGVHTLTILVLNTLYQVKIGRAHV